MVLCRSEQVGWLAVGSVVFAIGWNYWLGCIGSVCSLSVWSVSTLSGFLLVVCTTVFVFG